MVLYVALVAIVNLGLGYGLALFVTGQRAETAFPADDTYDTGDRAE